MTDHCQAALHFKSQRRQTDVRRANLLMLVKNTLQKTV